MTITVSSFDVFESLLIRDVAYPEDVYFLMAEFISEKEEKKHLPFVMGLFPEERIEAERQARQNALNEEVTLDEIYCAAAVRWGCQPDELQWLKKLEVDVTLQLLRPVPSVVRSLQAARAMERKIAFVSDMYLPRAVIKEALVRHDLYREGDLLLVSSDEGVTKRSGKLFDRLLQVVAVPSGQVEHTGDSYHTDIQPAEKRGIEHEHITTTQCNRYEQALFSALEPVDRLAASRVVAAVRSARLSSIFQNRHQEVIWNTACCVAAPALIAFAAWGLEQAKKSHIGRLYYEARDGQILWKIARRICELQQLDLDCRYLYGSRHAWFLPSLTELDERALEWCIPDAEGITLGMVAARCGLDLGEIQKILKQEFGKAVGCDAMLSVEERKSLHRLLQAEPVQAKILSAAKERRGLVKRFFEQEGLHENQRAGFVDSGWSGQTQYVLESLFNQFGFSGSVTGYYFSLGHRKTVCPGPMSAYFCDYRFPSGREQTARNINSLLEIMMGADHGSVLRYEKTDGKVVPVLAAHDSQMLVSWGVDVQQEAILAVLENLLQTSGLVQKWAELSLPAVQRLFDLLYYRPSYDEAAVYGGVPFSLDHSSSVAYPLAEPYDWSDVVRFAFAGKLRRRPVYADWHEGSMQRSSTSKRLAIRAVQKGREMRE